MKKKGKKSHICTVNIYIDIDICIYKYIHTCMYLQITWKQFKTGKNYYTHNYDTKGEVNKLTDSELLSRTSDVCEISDGCLRWDRFYDPSCWSWKGLVGGQAHVHAAPHAVRRMWWVCVCDSHPFPSSRLIPSPRSPQTPSSEQCLFLLVVELKWGASTLSGSAETREKERAGVLRI